MDVMCLLIKRSKTTQSTPVFPIKIKFKNIFAARKPKTGGTATLAFSTRSKESHLYTFLTYLHNFLNIFALIF